MSITMKKQAWFHQPLRKKSSTKPGFFELIHKQYLDMSNQPQSKIMKIFNAQQPAVRNYKQAIQFANRAVIHSQHLKVDVTNNKSEEIEIFNHFASSKDEKITKLTEIHFQNKIIAIFDSLSYDDNHMPINTTECRVVQTTGQKQNELRKSIIKTKSNGANHQEEIQNMRNRDSSHVIKNIFNLYQNWVEELETNKKQDINSWQIQQQPDFESFQALTFKKILHSIQREFGQEYINKSITSDKDSHIEALKKCRRICCDQQQKELKAEKIKQTGTLYRPHLIDFFVGIFHQKSIKDIF